MNLTREIHFRDRRPPHEIQFALERELMLLLQPAREAPGLVFRAAAKVNGTPHQFLLRFEAALLFRNCYSFRAEVTSPDVPPAQQESERKSLSSWFDLWTREFTPDDPPAPDDGSRDRYEKLAEQALAAEAHLTSVPAVQQAIVTALRDGATYSTAHKEGGTNIRFHRGRFVRADYGESSATQEFSDEAAFLDFLRKFYDWETSRHSYPKKVPEFDAWKLMLRLLRPRAT